KRSASRSILSSATTSHDRIRTSVSRPSLSASRCIDIVGRWVESRAVKVEQLIEDARKTILRAKENLSWTGDERDQARQFLELALGRAPKPNEEVPAPVQRRC